MNFFSRVPDGYYENNDALFLRKIVARNNYLDWNVLLAFLPIHAKQAKLLT